MSYCNNLSASCSCPIYFSAKKDEPYIISLPSRLCTAVIVSWSCVCRYIRTYTNTPDVFSFECGRRCSSGEGLFSFSTPTAANLAVEVQAAVDALQSSDPSGVESKYTSMTKQATTDTATTTSARPSESPRVSYVNVPEVKETMTGSQTSPGRCMRVHCRYTAV